MRSWWNLAIVWNDNIMGYYGFITRSIIMLLFVEHNVIHLSASFLCAQFNDPCILECSKVLTYWILGIVFLNTSGTSSATCILNYFVSGYDCIMPRMYMYAYTCNGKRNFDNRDEDGCNNTMCKIEPNDN